MGTWEWPLTIFTVLSQTAVGIVLVLGWPNRKQLNADLFRRATLLAGVLLALGLGVSTTHLGYPEAAYRALTHLSSSWLSREILLFGLTFVAWLYLYWESRKPNGKHQLATILTGFFGVLGIICSGMIYILPRVPAWNNAGTLIFFLFTAGVLGSTSVMALGSKELSANQNLGLQRWTFGALVTGLLVFILYLSLINNTPEGSSTAQFLLSSPLFWVRGLVGWVVPAILLFSSIKSKKTLNFGLLITMALCTGFGELLGRGLFYLSAVAIQITALK